MTSQQILLRGKHYFYSSQITPMANIKQTLWREGKIVPNRIRLKWVKHPPYNITTLSQSHIKMDLEVVWLYSGKPSLKVIWGEVIGFTCWHAALGLKGEKTLPYVSSMCFFLNFSIHVPHCRKKGLLKLEANLSKHEEVSVLVRHVWRKLKGHVLLHYETTLKWNNLSTNRDSNPIREV